MNSDYPTIPEIIERRKLPPFVFRGYSEEHEWVYGSLTYSFKEDLYYITEWNEEELSFPVEKESIGIWTGKLSYQQSMIWQDDIVQSYYTDKTFQINFGDYKPYGSSGPAITRGFYVGKEDYGIPFGTTIHDYNSTYKIIGSAYESKLKEKNNETEF